MASTLTCDGLQKVFARGARVGPLSFDVQPGEVFGLLGPDGAGKTTTMRMLCGIMEATAGSAIVLGHDVRSDPEGIKERIGYMSQRFSLYGDLTVAENIEFFADVFQVPAAERRARRDQLLAASRLTPYQERLAQDLSGGMKQKLGLVCTLIHTPGLLFLDEPTTGVDPVSRRDFWQILYTLVGHGMTLVVSTPYMDEAERCHRIALMNRGHILLCDTPQAVRGRIGGAVIELRVDRAWPARRALKDVPGITSVEVFGDRMHVVTAGELGLKSVVAALQEKGFSVEAARTVPPGLEDVFVRLMQEDDIACRAGN